MSKKSESTHVADWRWLWKNVACSIAEASPHLSVEASSVHIQMNAKLTRRRFFPLAAGGFAAAALSRNAWAATQALATGIQLYTVKEDLEKDPDATLKKLAQIGYTEVETAGFGKLTAAQFRDLLKGAGLHAPSAHLSFGTGDTSKLLDDAKILGAQYAVSSAPRAFDPRGDVQSFIKALNTMTVDDFKHAAAQANEFAQKAHAAGLQFAYHNHNFEFRDLGGSKTGYDILLRETDPALVKFEADCGWMKVAGVDPVSFLSRHPDRYVMLHIKDFKNLTKPVTSLMAPDSPTPTEVGRGSIDNKAIVEAGLKAGVKHMFVEQEPPFNEMTPMEAASVDYATLHSLLEKG
jgi:sugar phosphate isomerase/epimerase